MSNNLFEPINEAVYKKLYEKIIHLEYEPGQRLIETKLAEELGVSRSPVKLALERLEEERLVSRDFGKSPCVTPIQYEDCVMLVEARKGIEGICAYYAAKRITEEELKELKALLMRFKLTEERPLPEAFAQTDAQFHRLIVKAARNPYLDQAYAKIEGNMLRYRLYIMRRLDLTKLREYEHHIALYMALKNHSPVLARDEMTDAIDNMQDALRVL